LKVDRKQDFNRVPTKLRLGDDSGTAAEWKWRGSGGLALRDVGGQGLSSGCEIDHLERKRT
jgi:hypothetical protein